MAALDYGILFFYTYGDNVLCRGKNPLYSPHGVESFEFMTNVLSALKFLVFLVTNCSICLQFGFSYFDQVGVTVNSDLCCFPTWKFFCENETEISSHVST